MLAKLAGVDGAGSGLDADLLDGQSSAAFQQRINGSCAGSRAVQAVAGDGTVSCGPALPVTGYSRVLQAGAEDTLATTGDFRLVGRCVAGAGSDPSRAEVQIEPTGGALVLGFDSRNLGRQGGTFGAPQKIADTQAISQDESRVTGTTSSVSTAFSAETFTFVAGGPCAFVGTITRV